MEKSGRAIEIGGLGVNHPSVILERSEESPQSRPRDTASAFLSVCSVSERRLGRERIVQPRSAAWNGSRTVFCSTNGVRLDKHSAAALAKGSPSTTSFRYAPQRGKMPDSPAGQVK